MSSDLLAVDIGLNAIGWARWVGEGKARGAKPEIRSPDATGVIEIAECRAVALDIIRRLRELDFKTDDRKLEPWTARAEAMMSEFMVQAFIGSGGPPRVQVLEWPEFRAGSEVGHAAAAGDSLSKLAFMCGCHQRLAQVYDCATDLVPVSEWKGTLPKSVTMERCARVVGDMDARGGTIESHAWDAVGLGLHWMGWTINDPVFATRRQVAASPRRRVVRRARP